MKGSSSAPSRSRRTARSTTSREDHDLRRAHEIGVGHGQVRAPTPSPRRAAGTRGRRGRRHGEHTERETPVGPPETQHFAWREAYAERPSRPRGATAALRRGRARRGPGGRRTPTSFRRASRGTERSPGTPRAGISFQSRRLPESTSWSQSFSRPISHAVDVQGARVGAPLDDPLARRRDALEGSRRPAVERNQQRLARVDADDELPVRRNRAGKRRQAGLLRADGAGLSVRNGLHGRAARRRPPSSPRRRRPCRPEARSDQA